MRNFSLNIAAATALLFAPMPLAAQTTELIFNSYLPPFNATRKVAINAFAAAIEEESGGSISITIPDASLAPSHQQYQMLVDGVADMAFLPTDDMSQLVTFNAIADLPYNAPTAEAASVALWETYNEFFLEHGEYRGVVVLSTHVLDGRHFMGLDDAIDELADFDGTKFWVPNGPLTEIIEPFGAVPVHTNFPQINETVSKGLADAMVITPGSVTSARIGEYVHHYTVVPGGLGSVSFAVSISEERWNELTDDQRAAILRAAEGLPERTGSAIDAQAQGADMSLVTTIDAPEALMAALTPVLDEQVEAWKARAREAGLSDPDAVLEFYQGVVARVLGE